jgi:NADPH:quinone reductase-like Zn-dependent oxidoreductase
MVRLEMRALIARRYGPPEEYEFADVPVPEPGPGQIQVRIAAVSVNPADVRLPAGDFRGAVDLPFPHIPGNDFAGTVTAVGEGAERYAVGDEIFGFATPRALRPMGSSSLSTGAHVIATARDDDDGALVRSLGAGEVAGYGHYPPGVDLACNLVVPGNELDAVAAAVRPGGRLLTITFPPPPAFAGIDVQLVLDLAGRFGGMAEVAADAVAGRLRARIARRYEFEDAARALADFAGRHKTGKLVVRVRSRA